MLHPQRAHHQEITWPFAFLLKEGKRKDKNKNKTLIPLNTCYRTQHCPATSLAHEEQKGCPGHLCARLFPQSPQPTALPRLGYRKLLFRFTSLQVKRVSPPSRRRRG